MAISNSTDRFNGALASLAIKVPCVAVSNIALTLSAEQTVNGIAVVSGDRVLVKDQADPIENGIYVVSSSAWDRAPDWDGTRDVTKRTIIVCGRSGVQTNVMYQQDTAGIIRVGTDATTFSVFFDPDAGTQDLQDVTTIGNVTNTGLILTGNGSSGGSITQYDAATADQVQSFLDGTDYNIQVVTGVVDFDIGLNATGLMNFHRPVTVAAGLADRVLGNFGDLTPGSTGIGASADADHIVAVNSSTAGDQVGFHAQASVGANQHRAFFGVHDADVWGLAAWGTSNPTEFIVESGGESIIEATYNGSTRVFHNNVLAFGTHVAGLELPNANSINWLDAVAATQEMVIFENVSRAVAGVGSIIANFEGITGDRTYTGDDGRVWTFGGTTANNEISSLQAKFGSTSYLVGADDTVDDHIYTNINTEYTAGDFVCGTRDWFVRFWFWTSVSQTGGNDLCAISDSTTGARAIRWQTNNNAWAIAYDGTGNGSEESFPTFGSSPTDSVWHEVVFERVGNSIYCYQDGVLSGSPADCTGDNIGTQITGVAYAVIGASAQSGSFDGAPKEPCYIDSFEMRIGENIYGGTAPGSAQTSPPATDIETLVVGDPGFKTQIDGNALNIAGAYDLPVVDGTVDQVLVTDGAGTVSFSDNVDPSISEINVQNGNYTLVLADKGKTIQKATSTVAITHTIPANASVAYALGTMICFRNSGTVDASVAITTDTMTGTDGATGTRTLGANQVAIVQKITATTWEYSASDL